jgi:hypothetical protein
MGAAGASVEQHGAHARAPAPAPATSFRHRVAEHAASGALRDLLEHHRLSYGPEPLSEGAIFGLGGALGLTARVAHGALPAIDVDGRAASFEPELCSHLGLVADWCTSDDPAEAAEQLHAELAAGRPTLVRADIGELDYRGRGRHDTRHAIVVTCYDAAEACVWVADHGFPEPQRCSLESLARARRAPAWPQPARHGLLRPQPGQQRLADPRVAVWAALQRTVANMRTPPDSDHPHMRSGLAAIDAVAGAWPALPAMTGARLGQTLGALRFRIRDGGTGGALFRSLQSRFLHDGAALLGSAALGRAALVGDELADAWRARASALEIADAAVAHTAAAPWVSRVRTLEHRHVEALEAQLRTRGVHAA